MLEELLKEVQYDEVRINPRIRLRIGDKWLCPLQAIHFLKTGRVVNSMWQLWSGYFDHMDDFREFVRATDLPLIGSPIRERLLEIFNN